MEFIKNKKSFEMSLGYVVTAALLLGLLVMIWYGPFDWLRSSLFPTLHANTESVTDDCDGDGFIGPTDPCPCVSTIPSQQTIEKNQACPPPDPKVTANCPNLCKSSVKIAKK